MAGYLEAGDGRLSASWALQQINCRCVWPILFRLISLFRGNDHATAADARSARPRRRTRLRRGRLQRQQHGADPGHHGGRQRDRTAPSSSRPAAAPVPITQRQLPAPPDAGGRPSCIPDIPIVMHQDHGNSPATCSVAIDQGFTSRDDGRFAAGGWQDTGHLRVQRQGYAGSRRSGRMRSVSRSKARSAASAGIEDRTRGWPAAATKAMAHLTDPGEAERFVADTGCDALAVAIGTSHGAYKFTRKPDGRCAEDGPDRGDPPPAAEHAPGDARLQQRAARTGRPHQQVRRQDEGKLRRAGRGNPEAASSTACARSMSTPTTAWQ